jgi:hypothetical protein
MPILLQIVSQVSLKMFTEAPGNCDGLSLLVTVAGKQAD